MGNLDFSKQPGFSWYCVLLLISGILMLGMAGFPQRVGTRIANIVFGIGFAGYAIYLIAIFQGGTYVIFYKAFVLPLFLILGTIKSVVDRKRAKQAASQVQFPMGYGPSGPPQSGWDGYGQSGQPATPQPPVGRDQPTVVLPVNRPQA